MAQLPFGNVKTYKINGKQVKTLRVNGKELKSDVTIKFSLEMASDEFYYISGQSGTSTTQTTPADRTYSSGDTYGSLPEFGTISNPLTYVLNSRTYSVYVSGWYTDTTYTTKITSSDTVSSDMCLFAKWNMVSDYYVANAVTSQSTISLTIPKFVKTAYWECNSGGRGIDAQGSTIATTSASYDVSGAYRYSFAIAIAPPGDNSGTTGIKTFNNVGGKYAELKRYKCIIGDEEESVPDLTNNSGSDAVYAGWGAGATSQTFNMYPTPTRGKAVVNTAAADTSQIGTSCSVTVTLYYDNVTIGTFSMGSVRKVRTKLYETDQIVSSLGPYSGTINSSDANAPKGSYYITKFSTSPSNSVTAGTSTSVIHPNYRRTLVLRA